jgi:hypothetical protein
MLFGDPERDLKATYEIGGDRDDALDNLLALAGTAYEELQSLIQAGDAGRLVVWHDTTERNLKERFSRAWKQNELTVRFLVTGNTLKIVISMHADDFIDIDQRSDGLRQFVALRSYIVTANTASVRPILLIDEADVHLHYDAQADLVQVLEEQEDAAKVIYTTHSAGCLPRDLGTGIRAIVPLFTEAGGERQQTDHSEIINKFWTRGRGYSPILLAMGAGALAFSATRQAAVAEGMSDTLLLPTLIRDAVGVSVLPYQIAPSFAEATPTEVEDLDLLAARVAFIADGDDGGHEHVLKLQRGGILEDQVVFLGGEGSGLSVEDLIVKEIYVAAVNEELQRRYGLTMAPAVVPDIGRSKAVADWCKEQSLVDGRAVELSKVEVAQRILDQRDGRRLVTPSQRSVLRDVHAGVQGVLAQSTARLGRSAQ